MKRRCVVIRHVRFEDLDFLKPILVNRDFEISVAEPGIDELQHARDSDLLVILGGPIGVYEEKTYPWLQEEIAIVAHRLANAAPTLGICLGAQVIARAAGSRVYPGGSPEIGWTPVTLTDAGLRSPLRFLSAQVPVLHWHGDTFDLPDSATLLASTEVYPNQAFAIARHTLGLQFHIEVDPKGIERWLIGHAVELKHAGIAIAQLRANTQTQNSLRSIVNDVVNDWLDNLGERST